MESSYPHGFGSRGAAGKTLAVSYAREQRIPYLGICFGMHFSVIDFARNVAGLEGANSAEVDPDTPHPVIDLLPEQREIEDKGATMRLGAWPCVLQPGTNAFRAYGPGAHLRAPPAPRYELNPDYRERLEQAGHGRRRRLAGRKTRRDRRDRRPPLVRGLPVPPPNSPRPHSVRTRSSSPTSRPPNGRKPARISAGPLTRWGRCRSRNWRAGQGRARGAATTPSRGPGAPSMPGPVRKSARVERLALLKHSQSWDVSSAG